LAVVRSGEKVSAFGLSIVTVGMNKPPFSLVGGLFWGRFYCQL
jgi:hypothetical protein